MIYLSHNDANKITLPKIDMMFIDAPFEMNGQELFNILNQFEFDHLVLICAMNQLLEFYKVSNELEYSFDLVIDFKTPKKSKSHHQPNYLHSHVVYFRKKGIHSVFDRTRIKRHDHYSDDDNAYYPTIFNSPKNDMKYAYQKNQLVINDILGAFKVDSVADIFAGSGTTGFACLEHGIQDCYLVEKNTEAFKLLKSGFAMFGQVAILE